MTDNDEQRRLEAAWKALFSAWAEQAAFSTSFSTDKSEDTCKRLAQAAIDAYNNWQPTSPTPAIVEEMAAAMADEDGADFAGVSTHERYAVMTRAALRVVMKRIHDSTGVAWDAQAEWLGLSDSYVWGLVDD